MSIFQKKMLAILQKFINQNWIYITLMLKLNVK